MSDNQKYATLFLSWMFFRKIFFYSNFTDFQTSQQKSGINLDPKIFQKFKLSHSITKSVFWDDFTLKVRFKHFLKTHLKFNESEIKQIFFYNWFLSKNLLPVDTCPQIFTTEVTLQPKCSGSFYLWLSSHQMTPFFIQNENWEKNDVKVVKTSSFWTKKLVIWWLYDNLRAREQEPDKERTRKHGSNLPIFA